MLACNKLNDSFTLSPITSPPTKLMLNSETFVCEEQTPNASYDFEFAGQAIGGGVFVRSVLGKKYLLGIDSPVLFTR